MVQEWNYRNYTRIIQEWNYIIGEENGNLGRLGEREIKMFLLQGKRTKEGRQMKS